ncbi:MAG: ABC transporter ATP-binding protein [Dehalococcoidia bacterium]|jgi:ABC-type lipoprotein export system ATPase subunit
MNEGALTEKQDSPVYQVSSNEQKARRNIVIASKVTKVYGRGRTKVDALKSVDLKVRDGEFVAILGPSGSGKTTLLNMIGALDRPTQGRVIIDGVETSRMSESSLYKVRRERLGFIFQTYYLVPTLTALQNVLIPVLPIRGNKRYYMKAVRLLKLVGLKDRLHHKPGELSGGEQQRVAVARSLIMNPSLVLADEPTGNLDTKTSAEVINLMLQLNKKHNKTFIVVTHDRRLAERAERVLYLCDGRLSDVCPEGF